MEYGRERPKERKQIKKSRERLKSEWTTGGLEPRLTEKIKLVKKPSPQGFFIYTLSNLVTPVVKLGDAASMCTYGFRGASVTKGTFTYLKFIYWFLLFPCKRFLCSATFEAARRT